MFRRHYPFKCLDDFNRVVLDPEDGVADSDYVNASYVDVRTYFKRRVSQDFRANFTIDMQE